LSDPAVCECPCDDALRAFHAQECAAAEEALIRTHLARCTGCAARSAALVSAHESWVQRLRTAGLPPLAGPAGGAAPQIAGYEILGELSRGGQGVVFRALQKSTKREVALKILREGPFAAPSARRRFEREIELAASLQHPHLVTIFDSGATADGRRFFVMDYVHGLALDRYLSARLPGLPVKLALFSKICHAVNYAHQRGIIHRDLKPSNILVSADGEPHILDFGLARQVAEADAAALTTTGLVAGTLPYMSPEQARGLPDGVDVRSDVYSLGVMLYEMLVGTYPYPVTGDVVQVLRHIAETPPSRLRRGSAARPWPRSATAAIRPPASWVGTSTTTWRMSRLRPSATAACISCGRPCSATGSPPRWRQRSCCSLRVRRSRWASCTAARFACAPRRNTRRR
jgi:serine/threonine protein kinase